MAKLLQKDRMAIIVVVLQYACMSTVVLQIN